MVRLVAGGQVEYPPTHKIVTDAYYYVKAPDGLIQRGTPVYLIHSYGNFVRFRSQGAFARDIQWTVLRAQGLPEGKARGRCMTVGGGCKNRIVSHNVGALKWHKALQVSPKAPPVQEGAGGGPRAPRRDALPLGASSISGRGGRICGIRHR